MGITCSKNLSGKPKKESKEERATVNKVYNFLLSANAGNFPLTESYGFCCKYFKSRMLSK